MKIICVISGGLDSTTIIHKLKAEGHKIKAISFNYGQRHVKELEMAKLTCQELGIDHKIIEMQFLKELVSNSALTGNIEVPEGHYEAENMKLTVVPNRNMIMASLAIGYAVNEDFDAVALGVHAGDSSIYPDCREVFISALNTCSLLANYKPIKILAPYQSVTKVEIIKEGLVLGIDYSKSWSCYKGLERPCGKCGSDQECTLGFLANNAIDPRYTEEGWREAVEVATKSKGA